MEHSQLCLCLLGDVAAELGDGVGDVGPDEQAALIGVAVFVVEVHELDANDREPGTFNNVSLHGSVGDVLRLDLGGGVNLGEHPADAFCRQRVDRDENVVLAEGGFEDDRARPRRWPDG